MVLRLATGDRVPVDGEIIEGEVWLDEAMLTGEPIPQQRVKGIKSMPEPWYKMVPCYSVPLLSVAKRL